MAFIGWLPPESMTLTRMRDALTPEDRARLAARPRSGHGQWSHTDLLLALAVDSIRQQTWVLGEWKERPPAPEPIPRPGVEVPDHSVSTADRLRGRVSPRTWEIAEALRQGLPIPPKTEQ